MPNDGVVFLENLKMSHHPYTQVDRRRSDEKQVAE
jgi:hypothetical protein